MGMLISVYRNASQDTTNNGVSATYDTLCVVNVDGPFNPSDEHPAVHLAREDFSFGSMLRLYPSNEDGTVSKGGMAGGNYGSTSDSRFSEKCRELSGLPFAIGPIAIFDRFEG
mgnify:CR=1 FL=1|jgi:hypothetical protein